MLPAGLRVVYQPWLLSDILIEWAKVGFSLTKIPDVTAMAYRNLDLERDLFTALAVADWHKTKRE